MMRYLVYSPSTKRVDSVPRMEGFFGEDLTMFVHYSEENEYREASSVCRVVPHDCQGIGAIRNFMLDHMENEQARRVFMVDDDLTGVRSNIGMICRTRTYRSSDAVRAVADNAFSVLRDLDLPLYGWSSRANPQWQNNCLNFRFNCGVYGAWAIYGTERNGGLFPYRVGHDLQGYEDVDVSLRVMLSDRVTVMDNRWFWDFSAYETGLRTTRFSDLKEHWRSAEVMGSLWKGHVKFGLDGERTTFRIKVDRTSPLGFRG